MKLAWLEQVQKNPIFPLVQSGFFGSACLILYMPVSYYFPREWNTVIFLFCIYMLEKTISRSISRQLFCQNEVCFTMLLHLCAELFCIFLDQRSTFFFSQRTFALEEMTYWDLRVVAFQVAFLICKTQALGVLELKTKSILQGS